MSEHNWPTHTRGGAMFEPTEEQRRMVKVMSGFGFPQPDIASQIGIDAKTLRKHFREELDRGMTEANMRVAQSLFSMATTGDSVAAAIFWLKARAGWREKHPEEPAEEEKTTVVIYRWATDRYGNPVSQPFDSPSPVLSINKDGDGS